MTDGLARRVYEGAVLDGPLMGTNIRRDDPTCKAFADLPRKTIADLTRDRGAPQLPVQLETVTYVFDESFQAWVLKKG